MAKESLKLLYVEDSESDRETAKRFLSLSDEADFDIDDCRNGKEGLQQLHKGEHDAILLDFNLPDMTALDFLEQRENTFAAVLVLTSQKDSDVTAKLFKLGINDYLSKDRISDEDIGALICSAVGKRREEHAKELMFESVVQSREKANQLLDMLPAAFLSVDRNRRIVSFNKMAEHISGYKKEEVIGSLCEIFEGVPCENKCILFDENVEKPICEAIVEMRRKDGSKILVEKNSDLIRNEKGEVIGGIELFTNVTTALSDKVNLLKNEFRFDSVIRNISAFIYGIEKRMGKKKSAFFSPYCKELTGYSKKDFEADGALLEKLVFEADADKYKNFKNELYENGGRAKLEYRLLRKDGSLIWVENNCSVHSTGDIGYSEYGYIIDIGKRKAADKSIKRSESMYKRLAQHIPQSCVFLYGRNLSVMLSEGELLSDRSVFRWEVAPGESMLNVYPFVMDKEGYGHILRSTFDSEGKKHSEELVLDERIFSLDIIPVSDDGGKIFCAMVMIRDISTERRRERKLRHYSSELKNELSERLISIEKAGRLQRNLNSKLLPKSPKYGMAAFYMPSEELGGDFFELREENGVIIIIAGDCMGHGLEVSMYAMLLKAISDRYIHLLFEKRCGDFLQKTNKDIITYFKDSNYPVMFAAAIDVESSTLYYANANYELPYIKRGDKLQRLSRPLGFHLGYSDDVSFETKSFQMEIGDLLFVYSDAVVEIMKDDEFMYERKEIEPIFENFGKGLNRDIDYLIASLSKLRKLPLEDDATFIFVELNEGMEKRYEVSDYDEAVLADIKGCFERYAYSLEQTLSISTAIKELYENGIVHGNKNDTGKVLEIVLKIDYNCYEIKVCDSGSGFNHRAAMRRAKLSAMTTDACVERGGRLNGLGLWLVSICVDNFYFNESGNCAFIKGEKKNLETRYFAFNKQEKEFDVEKTSSEIDWSKDIDVFEMVKKTVGDLQVSFCGVKALSSNDIGKILYAAKLTSKLNRKLFLLFCDERNLEIIKRLKIHELNGIEIKYVEK